MQIVELSVGYSFGQIFVRDKDSKRVPKWTKQHSEQGFARIDTFVAMGTIGQFGRARIRIFKGPYMPSPDHQRVIAVPFSTASGVCTIEGPDDVEENIEIDPGNYNLVVAQELMESDDEEYEGEDENIDLYFELSTAGAERCQIILADDQLSPPAQLIESAEVS